jgi:hypothetical protein
VLSQRHLLTGLDGMARAFSSTTWTNWQMNFGHRSAGMICACYLVREGRCEREAEPHLERLMAREWAGMPLFAPLPEQSPTPRDLERLLAALAQHFGTHRHIGHDVIYQSLALRVLREHPETITPNRIQGLLRMAEAYGATGAPESPPSDGRHDPQAFSAWILDAFIRSTDVQLLMGHGHLLTFAHAVLDLYALGYTDVARRAEGGLRRFAENCLQPNPGIPSVKRPTALYQWQPESRDYWTHLPEGVLERDTGHVIKYAYAFTGFCRLARDPALVSKARECYRLIAG